MEKTITIRELSVLWKADKQQYVKQSTLSAYSLILEKHILPSFGNKQRFEESEVQDFVLSKLNDGLKQKTVKDILVVLKMMQKFGTKSGFLPFAEWTVKFPTERENEELKVLTITQQRYLMQYLNNNLNCRNLGIYICLTTGMRIGEICALKWGDINTATGTISVKRTIERVYTNEQGKRRTELVIETPKTKHSIREIPITKELMKMVRCLMKGMNNEFFVLTNKTQPTEPRCYSNYYKKVLKKLDIPDMKFHGLRHSFATRCIESQCDYKTVSVILGHANISTTLNLYVHPNLEQKKKCINEMMRKLNM